MWLGRVAVPVVFQYSSSQVVFFTHAMYPVKTWTPKAFLWAWASFLNDFYIGDFPLCLRNMNVAGRAFKPSRMSFFFNLGACFLVLFAFLPLFLLVLDSMVGDGFKWL